jgi:hypothetical protein
MYSVKIKIDGLDYIYALDNKESLKTLLDQSADFEELVIKGGN